MKKTTLGALALAAAGVTGTVAAMKKVTGGETEELRKLAEKHLGIMIAYDQWMALKQDGKNLSEYFEQHNYQKIAVYGMSYLGERLVSELKDTNIQVAYGIDQKAEGIYSEVEVKLPDDDLDEVDVVVVTAISFFYEIEANLEQKLDCPIISLEDVLYGL